MHITSKMNPLKLVTADVAIEVFITNPFPFFSAISLLLLCVAEGETRATQLENNIS